MVMMVMMMGYDINSIGIFFIPELRNLGLFVLLDTARL